jgi:hypothetical protein
MKSTPIHKRFFRVDFYALLVTLCCIPFAVSVNAQVQVNNTQNNALICSITYETQDEFYIQSSSDGTITSLLDGSSLSDPAQEPVKIYKITYAPGGNCSDNTLDLFPERNDVNVYSYNSEITNGDPADNEVRIIQPSTAINYNSSGTSDPPQNAFRDALRNVISIPDLRSYWSVDEDALTGTGFVNFISFQFNIEGPSEDVVPLDPNELILVTERWGNSTMSLGALPESDPEINPTPPIISGSDRVNINGATKPDLYQWNTGINVETSVDSEGDQEQWLILFEASQFNAGEDIFGIDVDLEPTFADGSILGFRNPGTLLELGECWRMLSSSPFTNTSYAEILEPIWTQGVPGAKYTGGDPNVYLWDKGTTGNSTSGWTTDGLDLNNPVPEGTGFLVSVFADDDFDNIDEPFPKELTVEGTENTGPVSPSLNSEDPDGWTLVGNPFGAPLDFAQVTKTNLTDVAYVYDRNYGGASAPTNGNTGGWRATSTTVDGEIYGEIENGLIAPFQGFFVQNFESTSSFIEFEQNDRSSLTFDPGSGDEWDFYGKDNAGSSLRPYVRLTLNGEGLFDTAWITFSEKGSSIRKKGDAYELVPFSEHRAMLSSKKGDELFDIAHFGNDKNLRVPISVETTLPGSYTLAISNTEQLPSRNLRFMDIKNDISMPFSKGFEYSFTIQQASKSNPDPLRCGDAGEELRSKFKIEKAKSNTQNRFFIEYADATNDTGELPSKIKLHQNTPNPFNPETRITYELPEQSDVRLEVFDLTGRKVATLVNRQQSAGNYRVSFNANNLSSGVYLYRLTTPVTTLSRKLTVIK